MAGDMPLRERQNLPEGLEEVERKRWGYSVVLDKRMSEVRDTLCTLAAPDALPALIHCAGGADRTGLITALVLGIAGVPAETMSSHFQDSTRVRLAAPQVPQPDSRWYVTGQSGAVTILLDFVTRCFFGPSPSGTRIAAQMADRRTLILHRLC